MVGASYSHRELQEKFIDLAIDNTPPVIGIDSEEDVEEDDDDLVSSSEEENEEEFSGSTQQSAKSTTKGRTLKDPNEILAKYASRIKVDELIPSIKNKLAVVDLIHIFIC